MIIFIDFLLFIINSNVDAFFYDIIDIDLTIDFRLKRKLDIDIATVLILDSVAHHLYLYGLSTEEFFSSVFTVGEKAFVFLIA